MKDFSHLPRILLISSINPYAGPGTVALDYFNAFKSHGIEIDLLTKYNVQHAPDVIYCKKKESLFERLIDRVKNRLFCQLPDYYFFYKKEINPPFKISSILEKIDKNYDVVFIVFWQGLLSFQTIDAIYDKLKCQIHFCCVDYSPMSGGCHFTGDCERYKQCCGLCPGIKSNKKHDFTHWNVLYREKIYNKVKPIVYGNTHMMSFFNKSYLLKNAKKEHLYPIIDSEKYFPMDRNSLREKYKISRDVDKIIFFGCQNLGDERKGMKYLLEALSILHESLTDYERNRIQLIIAGRNFNTIEEKLKFNAINLDFITSEILPEIYSLSDIFLCPSINDAGPTMVNQSLSCGTPVIAFEMGTALDVVKDKNTGYCAKLKDSNDFANCILKIIRLSESEYILMRKRCRKIALTTTSATSFIDNFMRIYQKYQN